MTPSETFKRKMRARALVVGLAAVTACGHEEPSRVPVARLAPPSAAAASEPGAGPTSYILADPGARDLGLHVKIGSSGLTGIVVDGVRAVVGKGEPTVAVDETPEPINGAAPIPARLGGGFLFHTDHTLYRADSFTGPLRPLGRTPETIQAFSFATKAVLLRCRNGERWAIGLPSGDRVPAEPTGVADVEALDDGRALAFDDQGLSYASTDAGAHWVEVTALLRSAPTRVANVRGELWFLETGGGAQRLEADGRLSAFDAPPDEEEHAFRVPDPRWRGADMPLRTAMTLGAALDETTAIVYADGDLVRVDLRTGDLVSVASGKLPPGATCQAVPTSNDVLFACASSQASNGGVSAFLASRSLASDGPVIEQSFAGEGHFWASDDGGVAFAAPCGQTSTMAPPTPTGISPSGQLPSSVSGHTNACVRQPDGTWRDVEVAVSALPPSTTLSVSRWVPRADGSAVALVSGSVVGVFDPRTSQLDRLPDGQLDAVVDTGYRPRRVRNGKLAFAAAGSIVDTAWSLGPQGALRGYLPHTGSVEIVPGGRVSRSPYVLDVVHSGAFALGRTTEGRLFQTSDHGATWIEVASPPTGASSSVHACTSAGCDLGAFYRIGWSARTPKVATPRTKAKPAPDVRRVRAPELTCRVAGPVTAKALPRTSISPEDLGLGAVRLPVTAESQESFVRMPVPRAILHPVHDPSQNENDAPALRGLLGGYRTTRETDVLQSMGPVKSVASLRRSVVYLAPFDPTGAARRGAIAMSDVITAGRGAGLTTDEILDGDMTETGNLVLVTPRDPAAASDIAFHSPRGLLALLRQGQDRAKVSMHVSSSEALVVSAATLPNDETALLEVESGGVEHVFKVGPSGTPVDLYDVGTNLGDAIFYPGNPDAIAVGPKGEVGLVRLGSGSEPASELDPALLLLPGAKPKPLAAWSTLRLAEDAACKADPAGFRTTLQVISPWVRTTMPDMRVEDAPMFARVRWNETRVCLEGLEVRVAPVTVQVPSTEGTREPLKQTSWIVSRGGHWARLAIGEGVEWRQPLDCSLGATSP